MTPRARLIEELRTVVLPWYEVDFPAVKSPLRTKKVKRARDACAWYLIDVKGYSAVKASLILEKDATSVRHASGRHSLRAKIPNIRSINYQAKINRYQSKAGSHLLGQRDAHVAV